MNLSSHFPSVLMFCFSAVLFQPSLRAQTAADINEGLRVSASTTTTGGFSMSWYGKPGRTYFIQTSATLMSGDWLYVPIIESGAGQVIEWAFTSTAPRFFLRLQYTDASYTGNVYDADFDGDKVSNLAEITQGTNPFSALDTDLDGMPDDWEIAMGLNAASALDALADGDSDTLRNVDEYDFALDPRSNDFTQKGTVNSYDLINRLTAVAPPSAVTVNYLYDLEGNLTSQP